jgi:hypothetical protein
MGEKTNTYRILVRKLQETDHFEDTGVDVSIILKCISRKRDGMVRAGFIWFVHGHVEESYKHGNET